MNFVDEAIISVKGGRGGDGSQSFRREKFLPKGGPDGGNGGKGGDVMLVVDTQINNLSLFRYAREFKGKNGAQGSGKNCTGASGADYEISVPPGTLVFDVESNDFIADMVSDNHRVTVAYGGQGGMGNAQFKSSTNRSPRKTIPGYPGEERELRLELRVLADVGLLGLPNAGKSTLLSFISNAKPLIGSYPFTTLHPQLGIVEYQFDRFTVADIPGLIKGAAKGAGLGIQFLRHLQRTRLLLHILDIGIMEASEVIENCQSIEYELESFDQKLMALPRWLILNKCDLLGEKEVAIITQKIKKQLTWTGPIHIISAHTGEGCDSLVEDIMVCLKKNKLR